MSVSAIDAHIQHAVVIGRGQVGTALANALQTGGIRHTWMPGRTSISDDFASLEGVDLWLIAVADDAIEGTAQLLPSAGLRVHFSGATPSSVLGPGSGLVTWPMASLRHEESSGRFEFPWLFGLNATTSQSGLPDAGRAWLEFLRARGAALFPADDLQRGRAHIASVFAANYTCTVLRLAHSLHVETGVPWEAWRPMVSMSVERMWLPSGVERGTGPAARNDRNLLKLQHELLSGHPGQEAYAVLGDLALQQNGFPALFAKKS
jgi:hypothetical protein